MGDLWHGHEPDWYTEAKAKFDERHGIAASPDQLKSRLETEAKRRKDADERAKAAEEKLSKAEKHAEVLKQKSPDKELHKQVTALEEQVAAFDEERDELVAQISAKERALVEAESRIEEAQQEVSGLVAEAKREASETQAELSSAVLQLDTTEQQFEATKKELDRVRGDLKEQAGKLHEAESKLKYLDPIELKDLVANIRKPRFIALLFGGAILLFSVLFSVLAMAEIQSRQQLLSIITARIKTVQHDLLSDFVAASDLTAPGENADESGETAGNETEESTVQELKAELKQLQRLQSDTHVLIATGATEGTQTLNGLRHQYLGVGHGDREKAPTDSECRSLFSWANYFSCWSSDLLLSLIVVLAGSIGAVIAAMRVDELFTFRSLGLGMAAGFITFLAIRSGRSVFLMQLNGAAFVLNPYTSAFFGLAAGLFTERAYKLLTEVIDKLIGQLQKVFVLNQPDDKTPNRSTPTGGNDSSEDDSTSADMDR